MTCGSAGATVGTPFEAPDNFLPICPDPEDSKYVRVAIHWLLPTSPVSKTWVDGCTPIPNPGGFPTYPTVKYFGPGNFTESGDGFTKNGPNGFIRAEEIINKANSECATGAKQWRQLPGFIYPEEGIPYPWQYHLVGTYFHRNNAAYNLTMGISAIHDLCDVDGENVLDIYMAPAFGSANRPTWSGEANAIGGAKKFHFMYDYYEVYISQGCRNWSTQYTAQTLNHESGHNFGLRHVWSGDDIDDTPKGTPYSRRYFPSSPTNCYNANVNCWKYNGKSHPCGSDPELCDDWANISNNLMDYNEQFPHALSPGQIQRTNADLISDGNSYVHSCNGCNPANAFFLMNDVYTICEGLNLGNSVILNGQGSFNKTQYSFEICEVNPSNPSQCVGLNYFTSGWIFNAKVDKIDLTDYYTFDIRKYYRVKLIVNSAECPLSSETWKVIKIEDCVVPDPGCCEEFLLENPTDDVLSIRFTTEYGSNLSLQAIHSMTGSSKVLMENATYEPGEYWLSLDLSGLPEGIIHVLANSNGNASSHTIYKQ
jgi:hypothetical protein